LDKVIPDPPYNVSKPFSDQQITENLMKDEAAVQRALDHYLDPKPDKKKPRAKRHTSTIFTVAKGIDTETLLAQAYETLASANIMASDLAFSLDGPKRNTALAVQQMISLGELVVDRALDNLET